MIPFTAVILAAGIGKRMNSELPKVLHLALGRPLIRHVLHHLDPLAPSRVVVVIGHKAALVRAALQSDDVRFAVQEPQLGTGHAVQTALSEVERDAQRILILAGDMPLVRTETLRQLLEQHAAQKNEATFLSGALADPSGYGRVIRGADGAFVKIVEERDATPEERSVSEINSGVYVFSLDSLREALAALRPENRQKEYYLTDCLAHIRAAGRRVGVSLAADSRELFGVNTVEQLKLVEQTLSRWGEA